AVEALSRTTVQIVETGARLADVARRHRKQRASAKDISARRLALEPLAQPQQRWAGRVESRGLLDEVRGHAADSFAPGGVAVVEQGLDLLPSERMAREIASINQPLATDDMQESKGKRGVAAGEGLQMQVGRGRCRMAHWIDDDLAGTCLGEPML